MIRGGIITRFVPVMGIEISKVLSALAEVEVSTTTPTRHAPHSDTVTRRVHALTCKEYVHVGYFKGIDKLAFGIRLSGVMHMEIICKDLVNIQIELEYDRDSKGDLFPRHSSTQQARLLIYKFEGEYLIAFRHDLPSEIRKRLLELPAEEVLRRHELIKSLFKPNANCDHIWYGSSLTFDYIPSQESFADVERHGTRFVIVKDGKAISAAWPARENDKASEVIVETDETYQRCGYGSQVLSAWASSVLLSGKIPFYSYEATNPASQALAKKLKLVKFCDVAAYD